VPATLAKDFCRERRLSRHENLTDSDVRLGWFRHAGFAALVPSLPVVFGVGYLCPTPSLSSVSFDTVWPSSDIFRPSSISKGCGIHTGHLLWTNATYKLTQLPFPRPLPAHPKQKNRSLLKGPAIGSARRYRPSPLQHLRLHSAQLAGAFSGCSWVESDFAKLLGRGWLHQLPDM
jgi:hypothetical protein